MAFFGAGIIIFMEQSIRGGQQMYCYRSINSDRLLSEMIDGKMRDDRGDW